MNPAQIHLALNHAPLFLSVIGALILFIGILRKNDSFIGLSRFLLMAAALFTIPVFLTGEGTEKLVEHLPGVQESSIESHEEMAKISLIIIAAGGLASLAGLLAAKKAQLNRILIWTAMALSLASFGTMAQTAHLGGLIRHTELQNPDGTVTGIEEDQAGQPGKPGSKKEDREDDD